MGAETNKNATVATLLLSVPAGLCAYPAPVPEKALAAELGEAGTVEGSEAVQIEIGE